ncbi:hypothetical protein PHYBLDRAFT_64210 [Phycomyces blakesleeanus NRRL 1555(-)]|uniref:Uncharacterized protein n=1 Tax=Phycomyces blakesleeanus (strain ATCC 8743b / DSM 1359 / FGSC 10004 / NBRC 33097 / NRRL 1555) TaxID=763407 RepID=A0A167LLL3_PHYB8|nr:hypothetical protein PHYBLDRAFT_64210 [Phycomyces blakesleeanus NRRL 1555(-)]OAD70708.1 hypothetical protein PHYBLDRAFT_64210 [Phycomyces blakesleeanus NRRL 1555(-)]|eukprot:XP_018288748.1 hypothetical protein PHYBLDRAFT_64210 [Phycomyces blakesleeanus NRRL 1555(-)]
MRMGSTSYYSKRTLLVIIESTAVGVRGEDGRIINVKLLYRKYVAVTKWYSSWITYLHNSQYPQLPLSILRLHCRLYNVGFPKKVDGCQLRNDITASQFSLFSRDS